MTPLAQSPKKAWLNLLLNIVIPVIILVKFSGEEHLGALNGLLIAMAFPLSFGIYELIQEKKVGFLSVLGLISVLLTGAIGVLQLPPEWVAIKEAGVPLVIGIVVIVSQYTRFPIIKKIFYNEMIMNIERIEATLVENRKSDFLEHILKKTTYLFAASFLVSAILNYLLAVWTVKSQPGTEAFNEELGVMTSLSFPVITIPSMLVLIVALWYFFKSIQKETGLKMEEMFNVPPKSN